MARPDYIGSYTDRLHKLVQSQGVEAAMESIVGGKFIEVGKIEAACLIHLGLQPHHTVVDVGCGSGRLAFQLREYLKGRFIGTDILHEPLDHARKICKRVDWEFIACSDSVIPCGDACADFVTFFSVFTHLLDEDIFRYLCEAKRVLKPSGRVVFSFLDFDCESHWYVFVKTVEDRNPNRVLNKFITKDTARRLGRGAGFIVDAVRDGLEKWIPVGGVSGDGRNSEEAPILAEFGQSVAVLCPFPEDDYLGRYPDVASAVADGVFNSGAHHYDVCGAREGRIA